MFHRSNCNVISFWWNRDQDCSPSRLQMNPSSAVGAVSHKYSLSSEFGETKISALQLQGRSAGSCTSSLSLESSEVQSSLLRSLQSFRITWDWASSHTGAVWIPMGLPWIWSKLSSELCGSWSSFSLPGLVQVPWLSWKILSLTS